MPERRQSLSEHHRRRLLIWIVMAVMTFGTQYFLARNKPQRPAPAEPAAEAEAAKPKDPRDVP